MILVTGARGFIGGAVVAHLAGDPARRVRAAVRGSVLAPYPKISSAETVIVGDLAADTDWGSGLKGVGVVVHCAARVHVMRDDAVDPLSEFRRVNVDGTLCLAAQAAAAGVRRFIFVSSIKVNGEQTSPGQPFTPDDAPTPADAYGVSKYEAEEGLRRLARVSAMDVVIIRPVLVYGPGVGGNFLTMMRWLRRRVPIPLGAIDNRRSLVALDNLVDLIVRSIDHVNAANQTFLVSDGEDLSTAALLRRLGAAMRSPARLVPVPRSLLLTGAWLAGKRAVARRLCGSLQVDIDKTHRLLEWAPPLSVDRALAQTAHWFARGDGAPR